MANKFSKVFILLLLYTAYLTAQHPGSFSSNNTGVRRKPGIVLQNAGTRRGEYGKTGRRDPNSLNNRTPAPTPTAAEPSATEFTMAKTTPSPKMPRNLTIGIILPYTNFGVREYKRVTNAAVNYLHKGRGVNFNFLKKYRFESDQVRSTMMRLTPSPTAILRALCQEFLPSNVSAILYLMNYEKYGRSTASAQYFLQLAGYLGIPVIAWNADNSGLERRASQSSLRLQLAPSLQHQTSAMLSILERYKWHQFAIVTSQIAGHGDFIQALRESITTQQDRYKFTILATVLVTKPEDLKDLVTSESRVMLLYSTRDEAAWIMSNATHYNLTGENYVWVVTQSVIGDLQAPPEFPMGMLGVHFDTSSQSLVKEISTAIKVYAHGVENFVNDPKNENLTLSTQLSCEEQNGEGRWKTGDKFFQYLRKVKVEGDHGKPKIEFTMDGALKSTELKIMNLRPGLSKSLVWEEIGAWKSWQKEGLDIKDIVWPGNSHTPPQGVPEKFHLRITFLEEPPYIKMTPPDPVSGKCSMNRGVVCRVPKNVTYLDEEGNVNYRNESYNQCCSGFCIDLLQKFAEELGFTYDLVRVEDGKWGTIENGKWNGLIGELVNRKTDMVMTSLMINSQREAVVDFTVPFLETGIAIVVAKRTGIISPIAFLEPFDTASWMLVGLVSIQAAAFHIFFFEWLSPSGYNMKRVAPSNHKFSLFRTYWLVWAVLFQAAVHVDSPRGFTARFMTNVWAMFAVVFLAIYTANLAAFMITREEFYEFSGLDDYRLAKPYSHKPMFRFGTVMYTHTEATIKKYFKEMHNYMGQFNKSVVSEGIEAVLNGDLDAFIYDGSVLDYLAAQDEDCKLVTMGSWYAKTGYGIAFPRKSKYFDMFNKQLLDFRETGDLERLSRYWMSGTCFSGKQEHKSSDPLALEQFLSAFLLLMSGILLSAFLLLLEYLYCKYIRKYFAKTDKSGCCSLISLSIGKSLTFPDAVHEAQDRARTHRCDDPACDTNLTRMRQELDLARVEIHQLYGELEAHGITRPTRRRTRSKTCWGVRFTKRPSPVRRQRSRSLEGRQFHEFISRADMRPREVNLRSCVSADHGSRYSEPSAIYRPYHPTYTTEIAEMETVL